MMKNKVNTIAFDADDTLWENETLFRKSEAAFAEMLSDYLPHGKLMEELYSTEMKNLPMYGYGIKGFVMSAIETALRISDNSIDQRLIGKLISLGQEQLTHPVTPLDGVEETLSALHGKYRLVLATKGDLIDQERKIAESGLGHYFSHVEVMSDKQTANYSALTSRIGCDPSGFMMIGNSLKSDIVPVLEIGGYAVHVPFHETWIHERVDENIIHPRFTAVEKISEIIDLL